MAYPTGISASTRAAIAYIVGSIVGRTARNAIYDYSEGLFRAISGTVRADTVNVYDFDAAAHITGSGSGGHLGLYHFGDSNHINLTIRGQQFNGYDFGSGTHFTGSVVGNSVSLYDYSEGQYYTYSL